MKAVFFLSTGRTGTKLLADYFAGQGDTIISVHEPRFSRHFRILSNLYAAGKIRKGILLTIFRHTRSHLFVPEKKCSHYLESNNFLYGYAPLFNDLFSDYKLVHIIRDPRDYIRSHINHGVFKGAKQVARSFVPYWFMDVSKLMEIKRPLSDLEVLAGRWVIVNRYLQKQDKAGNYLLVKFEDVVRGNGLHTICESIDLPFNEERYNQLINTKVNKGKLDRLPHWKQWTVEECKAVDAICGDYMKQFGYGSEIEWQEKVNSR